MSKKTSISSSSDVEKRILRVVDRTLHTHSMIQFGDAVLMGVSGGPDSVALFHILRALAPKYGLKLAIAHLNHGLRNNASDSDQAFVTTLAEKFQMPLHVERQDVRQYQKSRHLSVEAAARQVRYRFYQRSASKYGYHKVALGHHADDNAEQVLMAMLRGSGPLGLAGIPPVRSDRIIRPLINLRHSELLDFLAAQDLKYIEDSSNRDLKFLRNKIRSRLMPELQAEYNPKCVESLNRTATILFAEEKWIDDRILKIFKEAVVFDEPDRLGLSLDRLSQEPIAAQRRLIRKALLKVKGNLRRITFTHIEAVLKLVQEGTAGDMLDLPDRICLGQEQGCLLFSNAQQLPRRAADGNLRPAVFDYDYQLQRAGEILIKEAGLQIRFKEIPIEHVSDGYRTKRQIAFMDRDKVSFPLVIRNFRPGDRFSPLGIRGRQKLKKYFIDHKISRTERMKCPIVLSCNKIIWVAGHRLDNAVKIDSQTRRVLKAELLLA
ncbi:MAG: tRNA lysidine(34) synthetase TilS [Deltaproteobacteria bacterium]|jgi:tRNA(Ile)-lysidine synthase|nr:tRNA lysidine(34) synthetase TilS [Deltaproteobacteria bacterium]